MYVALEAESNTISPSEMNRSEGTSLNFYAIRRAANPNYPDFVGDARCGRIRNHERWLLIRRSRRVDLENVSEQTNPFSYLHVAKTLIYIRSIFK